MQVNKISNISFRENTLSQEMNSADAILMLRDPKALVKFKQNQEYARKADSVDANPFVALGYKLYRTFSMISDSDSKDSNAQKLNTIA